MPKPQPLPPGGPFRPNEDLPDPGTPPDPAPAPVPAPDLPQPGRPPAGPPDMRVPRAWITASRGAPAHRARSRPH
jgi:hypothetical protein